jgi:hypothetical protein
VSGQYEKDGRTKSEMGPTMRDTGTWQKVRDTCLLKSLTYRFASTQELTPLAAICNTVIGKW